MPGWWLIRSASPSIGPVIDRRAAWSNQAPSGCTPLAAGLDRYLPRRVRLRSMEASPVVVAAGGARR